MDKNDSFSSVEKELERVLSKFTTIRSFSERVLGDVATEMSELKDSIAEGILCDAQNEIMKYLNNLNFFVVWTRLVPPDGQLTPEQINILRDALAKSKEKLQRLTADHRDMHGTVSKVGKAIDRNFVCDLSSTARTDVLVHERNVQLLNKVIAQHFYRQGMDDVADTIIEVRICLIYVCLCIFNFNLNIK